MERDIYYQIKLTCIMEAFDKGFNVENPNNQSPQWIRQGVEYLRRGRDITPVDIQKWEESGGTSHLDPWCGTPRAVFVIQPS